MNKPIEEWLYQPEADATELDKQLLALARNLRVAGRYYQAETIGNSAAHLRETWSRPVGNDVHEVYDALQTIAESAKSIMDVIEDAFPNESRLNDPR
ncbi:hypothetical protein [Amycolatopsis anabasis]|uniref:hypothetical protein n=1 Tax=Amycolatopsis anabasis TaxID=1840409 RepID=UPI00131A9DB0|nr:hypothetical protein [Amycolatopsis anabasis]